MAVHATKDERITVSELPRRLSAPPRLSEWSRCKCESTTVTTALLKAFTAPPSLLDEHEDTVLRISVSDDPAISNTEPECVRLPQERFTVSSVTDPQPNVASQITCAGPCATCEVQQ